MTVNLVDSGLLPPLVGAFLDGTGADNTVTTEDKEADCTIKIDREDLEAILSGELNPMSAFMSGKIKVQGDMSVAMKLQSLLG